MGILVVSCSLNPESRSRTLALGIRSALEARGAEVDLLDLRDYELPQCDGAGCYDAPIVGEIGDRISAAEAIVVATPIYNFAASASAKNLIELTGSAWKDKIVGFLCAAGGPNSYMAIMGLANCLMLDFRALIVPRFVYAEDADFAGETLVNAHVEERLDELAGAMLYYAEALRDRVNAGR